MPHKHRINVLPGGPALVPLMISREVLQWSLCATGQAYSPEPLPLPAELSDPSLVEPFGGSLLHLVLRPSIKTLNDSPSNPRELTDCQISAMDQLFKVFNNSSEIWINAVQSRDLFGCCALDYILNKDVLRGRPLEHGAIADKANGQGINFRGIILSLTKSEMLDSDLFYGLKQVKKLAGVDLYPGISSANPIELRQILLRYFDKLNHMFDVKAQA